MTPAELKRIPHWIVWKLEEREGKPTKVPYRADGQGLAAVNDSATWADAKAAFDRWQSSNGQGYSGVGFVVTTEDPYCGIDLDHCRNSATGEVEDWASTIVQRFTSYTEITPSGNGLRIWIKGQLPGRRNRTGKIELYDHDRYFTTTGKLLEGSVETIASRQAELDAFYRELFPPAPAQQPATGLQQDVYGVIERARTARNGDKFDRLMRGDVGGYTSGSEADLALASMVAFWCPDAHTVSSVIRLSALWDEKWEREDYHDRTIEKAITEGNRKRESHRRDPLVQVREARELLPSAPEFTKVGLGYTANFADTKVQLQLTRVRVSHGEVSGELGVTVDGKHIYRGRFNVSSLTARNTASKYLESRMPNAIDWAGVLERFCMRVLEVQDRGQPFKSIGRNPRKAVPLKLVDPVLTVGEPTVIFGPGGTGKSTLGAALAVSTATGVEIVPGWHPLSAPVVVLDWESSDDAWNELVEGIARGIGIEPPEILYRQCRGALSDQVEEIAATVEDRNVELVIVDSVGMASGTSREGRDPNETAISLFDSLRLIGRTSLLIDHVAGADLERQGATAKAYGSIYKMNLARSIFELKREKEPVGSRTELLLIHNKVNRGAKLKPMGLAITYKEGAIALERTEVVDPSLSSSLPTAERIYKMLLVSGAQPTARVAAELGLSDSAVRTYLSRDARFTRLADGRIAIVTEEGYGV